jgi:hypothetical protein
MRRVLAMTLLILGTGISASFGARNTDALQQHRAALAWHKQAKEAGDEDALARASESLKVLPLPEPRERLMGWARSNALPTALGLVLVVAGGLMSRRRGGREEDGSADARPSESFPQTLASLIQTLDAMEAPLTSEPEDGTSPELREQIDDLLEGPIAGWVNRRADLIDADGLGAFAEYFGLFSAGERNLSRMWTTLTDGRPDVALDALQHSRTAFRDALAAYERLTAS